MKKSLLWGYGLLFLSNILIISPSCQTTSKAEGQKPVELDVSLFNSCSEQLTDVIVHDIFKPPVATRIYSYSHLAAYEAMRQQYPSYKTMAGRINQFGPVPAPQKGLEYCFPLAAIVAFNNVGEELTFSKEMWDEFRLKLNSKIAEYDIPDDVYQRSVDYGNLVAAHELKYAYSDNYKQTRGRKFSVINLPGRWVPTPPTYADACEPVWNSVRHFVIDSAAQFKPTPCAPFDMTPGSKYHKLLTEVYDISKNLTEEQKKIALFWDDNAFITHVSGHMMYATKKMTPPGHWLAIARKVSETRKLDMMKTAEVYLVTSLAMYDAFIASWDEKYKSNRVRPVTVIGQYLTPNWMPFLETPAFPEYVSAHSAISAAAGTVLTRLVGDNIAFTDSTEHQYGFGVRSFTSFNQAYNETNISRVYGGIHYRDGATEGMKMGEKLGSWVLTKLYPDSTNVMAAAR
jgi:hypothetical protein